MDPEIVRTAPGPCPVCGMALEPRVVTLDDGPNPELANMTRRLVVSALLSAPVFVLTMADMATGGRLLMARGAAANCVGLAFSLPVAFWAGWPFFERAWLSLVFRSPNMFTLVALGVSAAFGYSATATVMPSAFPACRRRPGRGAPPRAHDSGSPGVPCRAGPGAVGRRQRASRDDWQPSHEWEIRAGRGPRG